MRTAAKVDYAIRASAELAAAGEGWTKAERIAQPRASRSSSSERQRLGSTGDPAGDDAGGAVRRARALSSGTR
ncbi:MAG: hypothetical protein ABR569_01420 [Gaiellaceae bacterium]